MVTVKIKINLNLKNRFSTAGGSIKRFPVDTESQSYNHENE
jgi:hypothetical protein